MALAESIIFEIRPGAGADTNGAGFKPGASGTDYSKQNSAQYALTNGTTQGTTIILTTSAATDMVGNVAYITGGTGSVAAGWYEITAASAGVSITVDRSTGLTAGTGTTINIGGALATIGALGALLASQGTAGMVTWIKAGTNTLSTSSANVSGGILTLTAGTCLYGYNSARGDLSNVIGSASRPVIDVGAITTITVITAANISRHSANIKIDGKGNANITGWSGGTQTNCTAANCTIGFTFGSAAGHPLLCSALTCGTGFTGYGAVINSFTNDSTTVGFSGSQTPCSLIGCISINDAIASNISGIGLAVVNCTLHEATGDAITGTGLASRVFNNCFTLNGGDAIDFSDATTVPTTALIVNNAYLAGTRLYETTPPTANIAGAITLTGDPYTSEATDDLSPNNTASAGAALRGTGIDVYGQTDNRDVGAVQHADVASADGIGVNIVNIVAGRGGSVAY